MTKTGDNMTRGTCGHPIGEHQANQATRRLTLRCGVVVAETGKRCRCAGRIAGQRVHTT